MIPIGDSVPTHRFPVLTVGLIVANAIVWLFYQLPDLDRSIVDQGFFPCEVVATCPEHGEPWPLNAVSAMFLHGDWFHIVGNMLFLWIFGNNVEDAMGRGRFLVFYFLAGFAATAAQSFVTLSLGSEAEAEIPNVGASGAIAGVLGAYLLLYPTARVIVLVPFFAFFAPLEIPALFFLGFWFLFQLWQGGFSLVAPGAGAGIAFFAHVGGFVFGMLTVRLFAARRQTTRPP